MKQYEYKDDGGRSLCKKHHMLRCSECFYTGFLEQENMEYRESIKLALNHIHTGNFNLATVALNKALLKEVEQ